MITFLKPFFRSIFHSPYKIIVIDLLDIIGLENFPLPFCKS